jgi:hypothetical protein
MFSNASPLPVHIGSLTQYEKEEKKGRKIPMIDRDGLILASEKNPFKTPKMPC